MEPIERIEDEEVSIHTISVGQTFKPFSWKASHDMDFRSECLYCEATYLKGYMVEDDLGRGGRVAICTECERVNAKY
jgi:hypothetical protein